METFLLPSKVEFHEGTAPNSGTVVVSPCYHGYGTTLGNAFRRFLLSSLSGAAVEFFKIKGVQHEFGAVEGVTEDVVEIMLNLKQLAVKVFSDEPVILNLVKKGPGPVTAGDISPNSAVEVVNKDLVLATLTKNKTLEMEIVVGTGRGYRPIEEKNKKNYDLGTILVDSVYTPVKDVGYHVEYTRVGDITNYEKLTINIETNGTISPREALRQSNQILMDHFTIILDAANSSLEEASMVSLVDDVADKDSLTEEGGDRANKKSKQKEVKEKKTKAKKIKK